MLTFITFGINFASMTETPRLLAAPPYNLPPNLIGLVFLARGLASMVASLLGGRLSDASAAAEPDVPQARMRRSIIASVVTLLPGVLLFGWALGRDWHVAVVAVSLVGISTGNSFHLSSVMAYVTTVKQASAGAAAAAMQTAMFVGAGVSTLVVSAGVTSIGSGWCFTAFAGVYAIVAAVAYACVARASWRRRQQKKSAVVDVSV